MKLLNLLLPSLLIFSAFGETPSPAPDAPAVAPAPDSNAVAPAPPAPDGGTDGAAVPAPTPVPVAELVLGYRDVFLVPIPGDWTDGFTNFAVLFGFPVGILHICLLIHVGMHKADVTSVVLMNAVFIWMVAFARLFMFMSAKNQKNASDEKLWDTKFVIGWCFFHKTWEIWAIGMSNSSNALMSLAYVLLARWSVAISKGGRIFKFDGITKPEIGVFFFSLFICSSVTTFYAMRNTGLFLMNDTYCLAIGATPYEDDMFALWLGLCACVPSLISILLYCYGFYLVWTVRAAEEQKALQRGQSSEAVNDNLLVSKMVNMRRALSWQIISWFVTNLIDLYWIIYYPFSKKNDFANRFYLVGAQIATLQNVSDFTVNLHFFILPKLGFKGGISEYVVEKSGMSSRYKKQVDDPTEPSVTGTQTATNTNPEYTFSNTTGGAPTTELAGTMNREPRTPIGDQV